MLDQTVKLRTQQIIEQASRPILVQDAIKQALADFDRDQLLEMVASMGAAQMKGMRKQTYELPDQHTQLSLFEIPAIIGISTPEGDELVHRDQATLDEVRQWAREGARHHQVQLFRFVRARADLATVDDVEGVTGWPEARKILGERHSALPAGEQTE